MLIAFLAELDQGPVADSLEPLQGLSPVLSQIGSVTVAGASEFQTLSHGLFSRTRNEAELLSLAEWLIRVAADAPYVRPVLIERLVTMLPELYRSVPRRTLSYIAELQVSVASREKRPIDQQGDLLRRVLQRYVRLHREERGRLVKTHDHVQDHAELDRLDRALLQSTRAIHEALHQAVASDRSHDGREVPKDNMYGTLAKAYVQAKAYPDLRALWEEATVKRRVSDDLVTAVSVLDLHISKIPQWTDLAAASRLNVSSTSQGVV